jgi:hypothetical protein
MFASFAPASKLVCGQLRGSTGLARTLNSYIPEIAKKYYTVAPSDLVENYSENFPFVLDLPISTAIGFQRPAHMCKAEP